MVYLIDGGLRLHLRKESIMPGEYGCPKYLIDWCDLTPMMWVREVAADNPHLVVLGAILVSAALAGPLARHFL